MSRNTSYDSHGYSDHRQPSHQPDSRFENSSYSSGTGYANRNDSASYGSDPRYPNHVDNPPYPSDSRYPDHNNNPPYQSDSRYPSNNNPPFSSDSRYPNRNDNPPYQSDTRYPNHNDHSQYGSDGRYSSNDNPAYGTEPRYSNQNTHAGYSNQDDRRNDFDYDDRAPDNYSNYPPKQFGNDSAPSAYANRDRPKPYDRARPNERRPAETKRTFGEFKVPPGPVCVPSRYDASVPNDCIKFLSRTLYISDMPASCTKEQLKKLLQQAGRVESMTFNTQRMCSFIKTPTRKEAEDIRNQFQGYKIDNQMIKIGWGCGYGPREHFNYAEGVTLFPISKIPLQDQAFIVAAPPRGGGPIEGSTVTEEPNVPLELALSSRGSSTAPRVGLPPRRRDRRDERGDYGGGRY
ncbi:hypothetical protein BC833DRAFT_359156 [Globomyces pollinis-pini]|nr:hypothetical protein BC833DRAFT_359156 [Globomyces pollinis-pini]